METVVVGCKIPSGVNMNGRKINGCAQDLSRERVLHPGGFALTHGVPAVEWAAFYKANLSSLMVVNNLIFASPDEAAARRKATRLAGTRSGFEQR